MKKKWILLTLLFLLALPGAATAREYELRKVLTGTLSASATDHLKVQHSLGNVTLIPSNKTEVSYEAVIEVKSNKEDHARRMLEEFTVDFAKNGNTVYYKLSQKPEPNLSGSRSVHLTVYLPVTMSLELRNSFGDVNIPDMQGSVTLKTSHGKLTVGQLRGPQNTIEHTFGNVKASDFNQVKLKVSHGNFEGGNAAGEMKIEMRFGNVVLGNTGRLSADISNGHFTCDGAGELEIKSRFGNVKFNNAGRVSADISNGNFQGGDTQELDIKSRFGNVNIGNTDRLTVEISNGNVTAKRVEDAKIDARFSKITIDGVGKSLVIPNVSNGGVTVGNISAGARTIEVQSRFAGITLNFDRSAQLDYQLETTFGKIDIRGFDLYHTNTVDNMNRANQSGKAGAATPANPTTVRIKTSNGNISLRSN